MPRAPPFMACGGKLFMAGEVRVAMAGQAQPDSTVKPPVMNASTPAELVNSAWLPSINPLREIIAAGKMPIMLELHLTEADREAYETLLHRYHETGAADPTITLLGQYLRQLDAHAPDLTDAERSLTRKVQAYADLINSGRVDLVALDDGARGRPTLDNLVAAELLAGLGADPARLIANVVARNRMPDELRDRLIRFARLGVRNALLLTGDLPIDADEPARFPMDSVGMCDMARQMQIDGALPGEFTIAAAGHPNPDVDPDGFHTLHKVLAGARVIITQAIYDLGEFSRWMACLEKLEVTAMADVIAEIIPITSARQLNLIRDVPGIRIPQQFINDFQSFEQRTQAAARAGRFGDEWIRRQQKREAARVTRELLHRVRQVPGVRGFYLGCLKSFDPHLELLKEAPLHLEASPTDHRAHVATRPEQLEQDLATTIAFVDQCVYDARKRQDSRVRKVLHRAGQSRFVEHALKVIESVKVPTFGCKKCDRCDLSQDALICPRGCAKQMTHGPCGAPLTVDGRVLCEDRSRECTWAHIRTRRVLYDIAVSDQLEIRKPPSPGFFYGQTYSAVTPVLRGEKAGPDWSLAWRALLAHLLPGKHRQPDHDGLRSVDLQMLLESKRNHLMRMVHDEPELSRSTAVARLLALIATPGAIDLLEHYLGRLGLPCRGAVAELSPRELFEIAGRLPEAETSPALAQAAGDGQTSVSLGSELLAIVPEGSELRKAIRRELLADLIRHVEALGIRVTYADVLLEPAHIGHFSNLLPVLKDEVRAFVQPAVQPVELTVHFDRVHYRKHYRPAVSIRRIVGSESTSSAQLTVDVRQCPDASAFQTLIRDALERLPAQRGEADEALVLEEFAGESRSICWSFNRAFWNRLGDFEQATGINYDASIGGSTDHNLTYVRSTARAYFDRVMDNRLAGQRLCVVEIGVASTLRARAFLDELRRLDEVTDQSVTEQTTYVLADFSKEILARGAEELAGVHPHVETVLFDAADPSRALGRFRKRIMHVHLCNVYDNLPTDKVARIDTRLFNVEARAYLPVGATSAILHKFSLNESLRAPFEQRLRAVASGGVNDVNDLLDWLRRELVAAGRPPLDYVHAWMDLISAMKLEERLVPITRADQIALPPLVSASPMDLVQGHLPPHNDWCVHLNQESLSGFVQLLDLLHPGGVLEVVDLFVRRVEEYNDKFKGPAKYDGSTVNWLNGPLFRAVGERLGYSVRFNSFRPFDPKSPSIIMLASPAREL